MVAFEVAGSFFFLCVRFCSRDTTGQARRDTVKMRRLALMCGLPYIYFKLFLR